MTDPRPYRPHAVIATVTRRIALTYQARTPEQAEAEVPILLVKGELDGETIGSPEVELEEVYAVEELSSDEIFKSDPTGFHS